MGPLKSGARKAWREALTANPSLSHTIDDLGTHFATAYAGITDATIQKGFERAIGRPCDGFRRNPAAITPPRPSYITDRLPVITAHGEPHFLFVFLSREGKIFMF